MTRFASPSFVLVTAGIVLIASGVAHIPVWLVDSSMSPDGSSWEGTVSWRKPILFGVSTGLTLWSLGWIVAALKQNRIDTIVSLATAISLVVEVGLITLQQWRGQASHSNQATAFDAWVDIAMLVLICVAVAGIVYIAFRTFSTLNLDDEYALAARLGLLFLILSCAIGFVISSHGYAQVEAGLPPEKYGESGVTKFPHGVAIHVLQVLPMMVLLLRKFHFPSWLRRRAIWCVAGSHCFLLAFACVQTLAGKARFDFDSWFSAILFSVAIVLLIIPVVSGGLSMMPPSRFYAKQNSSGNQS